MKYLLLISVFAIGCITNSIAQVNVSGFVHSEDSLPVSGADILIHNVSSENKPLIKFTRTNEKGYYAVTIENMALDYSITVKANAFRTENKELKIQPQLSDIRQDFVLHPSVSYLDTVRVNLKMSISQTGDTITFNPDAFALKNEVTVEELLSRLPGMEIKEDGKIFFNGKMVSGVLIDGDDLFRKDYQLLTQNAAPRIVDKVQVFKNYQKDQLLKEFDQPGTQVINLKIKDQYKNYLFGHGALGYGNKENKLADLFLIMLSPRTKIQAGANYNRTGSTYTTDDKLNTGVLGRNENSFFSYSPATPFLTIYRYYFQNIPGYYQDRNESMQAHTNVLIKKNNWESNLNAKFATDRLRENQQMQSVYQDGTLLFTNNTGLVKDQLQEYNLTSSKKSKKETIYFSASLQNKHRDYGLHTASNQSLKSKQQLTGDNLMWQLNFSFHKKLKEGLLWSSTFGFFDQTNDEHLHTNPDFLFWLFPDDLSLNILNSNAGVRLRYLNAKSSLLVKGHFMTHDIGLIYSSEKRIFDSRLNAATLRSDSVETPFENNNSLHNPFLALQYKGRLRLSAKKNMTLSLSNEPHFLNYRLDGIPSKETRFFYDYSVGMSSRLRTSNWGLTLGVKRQSVPYNSFFPNFVQTDFHRLQSGFMDTKGKKSTYIQASYSLFSVRLGWIAFFLLNLSHDHSNYIRNLETKGIGTISSFSYDPKSTNQMFFVFNSQKTLGEWPFSLNSNVMYSRQSAYNGFNGKANKSDFQFFNGTIGIKSQFKSFINLDYHFSLLHSKNKVKSPKVAASRSNTFLNKLNLFLTPKKLFNSTVTFNSMVSNSGTFQGNFLDLAVNRKLWKEKLLMAFNFRNIFDKKYIANTTISALYNQENRVEIRGREFFVTIRYEIR